MERKTAFQTNDGLEALLQSSYLQLDIHIKDHLCVVVSAGKTALTKAVMLAQQGARIVFVTPGKIDETAW